MINRYWGKKKTYLSIYPSIYPYQKKTAIGKTNIYLSIYLFIYPSIYTSIYVSMRVYMYIYMGMSRNRVALSFHWSIIMFPQWSWLSTWRIILWLAVMVEPPLWKMMEWKSVGMIKFPTEWKNHPVMFQTTNQVYIIGVGLLISIRLRLIMLYLY